VQFDTRAAIGYNAHGPDQDTNCVEEYMQQGTRNAFIFIIVLTILAAIVVWPGNPGIQKPLGLPITRDIKAVLGLDLQGGLQLVLQGKGTAETPLDAESMATVKTIIENRVNALGVTEPQVQMQGNNRILVELPGIKTPKMPSVPLAKQVYWNS
jgi:preprotein translocase subunit SecD